MHLTYQEHAMLCEFTLMTVGDYRGSSMTPAPISVRGSSTAPTELRPSRQPSAQPTRGDNIRASDEQAKAAMPPPSQPASRSFAKGLQIKEGPGSFHPESLSQRPSRPSPPPPRASLDPESLFLPAGDGDRQWDETNFDEEEDTLGWDASGNQVGRILIYITAAIAAYVFRRPCRISRQLQGACLATSLLPPGLKILIGE